MQRVDSKYLKRITRTVNVDGYLKDVEDEVLEEIAAAIKRTDNKVNFAMLRMEMAEEDLDKAIAAADRAAEIEAIAATPLMGDLLSCKSADPGSIVTSCREADWLGGGSSWRAVWIECWTGTISADEWKSEFGIDSAKPGRKFTDF